MTGRKSIFENYIESIAPSIEQELNTALMISSDKKTTISLKRMPHPLSAMLKIRIKREVFRNCLIRRINASMNCIADCIIFNSSAQHEPILWKVNVVFGEVNLFVNDWKNDVLIAIVNTMKNAVYCMQCADQSIKINFSEIPELRICHFNRLSPTVNVLGCTIVDSLFRFIKRHMPSFNILQMDEYSMEFQLFLK